MEKNELTEADLLGLIKNLTRLHTNLSKVGTPDQLYRAYKHRTKLNDLLVAQKLLLGLGLTEEQVQQVSKLWKANYGVTPKDVRASYGTGQSTITDNQILGLFQTVYDQSGMASDKKSAKKDKGFAGHIDNFDDDLESIVGSAKQFGVEPAIVGKLKNEDWSTARRDPNTMTQLAGIGYAAVQRKRVKSGRKIDDFSKDFDDIINAASKFGLKNPAKFVKDVKRENWQAVTKYPAAMRGLAAIGFTLLRW